MVRWSRAWALALLIGACCGAPQTAARLERADPPATAGAFAPRFAVDRDGLLMSWLEPAPSVGGTAGHRFVVSRHTDEGWQPPVEIASGEGFFANWADVPGIGVGGDGSLVAHWLFKTGAETYTYAIRLARSVDGGSSWTPAGRLNDDDVAAEHGFVSWAAEGEAVRAVWLDGRAMPDGGPMTLRTAVVGDEVGPSSVLDERVCECCPTDLAITSEGALAVYRDRGEEEMRNIGVVAASRGGSPGLVNDDGWRIAGCPVNGPAIDADGDTVVVAWFTQPVEAPEVRLAFSYDGGRSFGGLVRIDEGDPLGRVDVELDDDGSAVVVWLEAGAERARLMGRRVGPSGGVSGNARRLAETEASRAAGVPRLARSAGEWWVAWVEAENGAPEGVRAARLDVTSF